MLREAEAGSLTISKTVTGSGFDPTKTFELQVVFSDPVTYNGTTSTTHTIRLAHGQSVTIPNIPVGTTYTVAESPLAAVDIVAGYAMGSVTGASGTISMGVVSEAAATNQFTHAIPAGTIRFEFVREGYDPAAEGPDNGGSWPAHTSWTQVSASPNVWDMTYTAESLDAYGTLDLHGCIQSGGGYAEKSHGGKVIFGDLTTATGLYRMFGGCNGLTEVHDLRTLNGEVGIAEAMFKNCTHLTDVDLFDTRGATTMQEMFYGCSSLQAVPALDMSSCVDATDMFTFCTSLTSAPLCNTGNVTIWAHAFSQCDALLITPDLDLAGATDVIGMFAECDSLTTMRAYNTANATDMRQMFDGCTALEEVLLLRTDSARYVDNMFRNCRVVESGALALYQQMSSQATPPSSHTQAFLYCGADTASGTVELAQIPTSWGGTAT